MPARHDRGTVLREPLDRGDGRDDAQLVGDGTVGQRHVEVGADQDAQIAYVSEVLQAREVSRHVTGAGYAAPMNSTRSIKRFE